MAILAYKNQAIRASFTDVGGTFNSSPPIANMSTPQVPLPNASFTGTSASFSALSSSTEAVRMLALLSHNLPEGAVVTWKDSGGTTLASQSWSRFGLRPMNLYTLLGSSVNENEITCEITGVASGTYRIGTMFFGPVWEFDATAGWDIRGSNSASVTRIQGTDWVTENVNRRSMQVVSSPIEHDKALGVALPGDADPTEIDVESIMNSVGMSRHVIYAPRHGSQDWLDSTTIYGLINRPHLTQHMGGPYHRAEFGLLEQL